MVGPTARRQAVRYLLDRGACSQRRACRLVGWPRSVYRREPQRPQQDRALRQELHRLAGQHPRYGYRRIPALLRRAGWVVNHKQVQRLWREEGLKVPTRPAHKRPRGQSTAWPTRAEQVNHVWTWDFIHDTTTDGRALRILSVLDEFSRTAVCLQVARSQPAQAVIRHLAQAMAEYGRPGYLRSDNGPEFIAHAVAAHLQQRAIGTIYITPGSPWENPYVESFHGKLRDECLNRELFGSLVEARVILADHQQEYNTRRPHSGLQYHTPEEILRRHRAARAPALTAPPS